MKMKKLFQNKFLKKTLLSVAMIALLAGGVFVYSQLVKAASGYSVTEATATVGTATNLEIEYTVDTGAQTWADADTLTVELPANFPVWSALTTAVEYDTDATDNGVGETVVTQGTGNGQYSISSRTLTVKWNLTDWGAVVNGASTVRILVTAGATPMYALNPSTFTFGGTTAAGGDTDPSDTADFINVSAADPLASINVTAVDEVGETGNVVATFAIAYPLVDNDQVWLTFPANFDVSGATYASDTFTGDFDTCSVAGQVVKCDASGGIAAQGAGTITISGIKAKYAASASTYTTALYDVSATANISSATDDVVGATTAVSTLTATFDASAVTAVGDASGQATMGITFPVALVAGDTVKMTFPANWDVSGLTVGANKDFNLDNLVAVAVDGQVVTLTLEGAQGATAETINFETDKITPKYVATGQTVAILIEKAAGQDVVAASADAGVTKSINDTTAADPNSSIDVSAVDEINATGNVVVTLDVDYAMVAGDTVALTFPSNYNVASAAYSADSFTGAANFTTCVASSQVVTCTVGADGLPKEDAKTLTISGITASSVADASTYTTTLYDTSATANIATASDDVIAATTADVTAPTVVDNWTLNMNTGIITINFSENMATTNVDETKFTLQQSNDTDTEGEIYTLTDSTAFWTSSTTIEISLSTTDKNAIKADTGLGISTGTSFLEVVAGNLLTDAAGNALSLTNVTDAACIDATTYTADTTAPTFTATGTSVNAAGDTVALVFNEPMTTATLSNTTGITSITGSISGALTLDNDTGSWSGNTYTVTLNEATDGAYIQDGETLTVVLANTVTDLAPVPNAVSTDGVISAAVEDEDIAPTFTATGVSVNAAGDTIALAFNELMTTATLSNTTGITSITGSLSGAFELSNDTGSWSGNTYTITLNETTDGDYIQDGETVTVVLADTVTDVSGNAVSTSGVVSAAVAKEATAPTVVDDWTLNMNAGTMTINFSEQMDTSQSIDETTITLQQSIDTDTAGEIYTLTDSVAAFTDPDTLVITLSTTDKNAIKTDTGLGVSTATSFLEIVASSNLKDLAGNDLDLTNVTDAACIDATTYTADAGAPTYTATGVSVDAAGDTIALVFNEPMDTATLSNTTGITSVTDSSGGALTLANDTGAWTGLTIYTITLDETTDGAFIRDGATVSVVLANTVLDISGNAVGQDPVVSAAVADEDVAPTYTATGVSINDAGDTIALVFNEPMNTATLSNSTGITSITDSTGGALTLSNDTGVWTGLTTYTITLNEATDVAFIRDGATVSVVLANTVTDLTGNPVGQTPVVSAAVSDEDTVPTITSVVGASVSGGGDTITITSNEILSATATTTTNWTVQYDDNGAGLNIQTLSLANAVATFNATRKIVTITLDEVTDGSAIPSSKYIKVTPGASITDLTGNTGVAAVYSAAAVTGESTAPTITTPSPVDGATDVAINTMITVTLSEALRQETVNGNTVKLYTDVGNNNAVNIGTDTEVAANVTLENNGASTKIYIDPVANLSNSGNYIYRISTGVKDLAGNALAANGDYDFTTVAGATGTFGIISTTMTKLTGTADNTYGNGWEWVIRMTLPTDQTDFALKFNNWASGSNSLLAANNMQYYSEQIASGAGSSGSPVTITAADLYPSNVTVTSDADATTAGVQTDIHVKVKIPASTASGSYSTSYRVNYE